MKIIIPRNNLLGQLFPGIQDYKNLTDTDLDLIKQAYTFQGKEPEVSVSDDLIIITLDDESVLKESEKLDQLISLCEKQRYDQALELVNRLLEKAPATSDYYRIKGQIYSDQNHPQEAIDELIEAVRLNPNNSSALIMLGNIYAKDRSDADTALTFFERVLETDPENHLALNNMGGNLANLGNYDDARRYFELAHELNPDYPNTLHGLALLESKRGNSEESFEYARQAFFKLNRKSNTPLYRQNLKLIKEESRKYMRGGGFIGINSSV